MTRECFARPSARDLLAYNDLDTFDALWNLDLGWFEAPNYRRNGWSGISRHCVKNAEGTETCLFIKRQLNHRFRCATSPLRGLPTLFREFSNIRRFESLRIGTVKPVYYGEHWNNRDSMAILVTHALEGFVSLGDWSDDTDADRISVAKEEIVHAVADVLHRLHRNRLQHGCLYGKHIFIGPGRYPNRNNDPHASVDIRLIDLEKVRRRHSRQAAAIHDLDQLYRHAPAWFGRQHEAFMKRYDAASRNVLWRKLQNKWCRNPPDRRPTGIDPADWSDRR